MRILSLFLLMPLMAIAAEARFSDLAWESIQTHYKEITKHPFNQELAKGTLSQERFRYYNEQDSFYLVEFAKALGILATKLEEPQQIKEVLGFANDCIEEKEDKKARFIETSYATFTYSQFLLSTAAHKSKEELAAALLPCFWIYLRLALDLKALSPENNPYKKWIELYSSEKYKRSVEKMIEITNTLAEKASKKERERMLKAFVIASKLEWYFWDDAYQMRKF